MPFSKRILNIFLVVPVVFICTRCVALETPIEWRGARINHQVVIRGKVPLQQLWQQSIYTLDDGLGIQCVAFGGKVFINGSLNKDDKLGLIVFNGENGKVLWSTAIYGDLSNSDKLLFVGNESFVTAFEPMTGEKMWSTHLPGVRNVVSILYFGDDLYVSTTGSYSFYVLSSQNGIVVEKYLEPGDFRQIYPSFPFYPDLAYQTVIIDNINLRHYGQIVYQVYAFDGFSNRTIWESEEEIISNASVAKGQVFMLTNKDELKILDLYSGKLISSVLISPSIDFFNHDKNPQHDGYYTCADNKNGLVYLILGDSRQLFAFKIID